MLIRSFFSYHQQAFCHAGCRRMLVRAALVIFVIFPLYAQAAPQASSQNLATLPPPSEMGRAPAAQKVAAAQRILPLASEIAQEGTIAASSGGMTLGSAPQDAPQNVQPAAPAPPAENSTAATPDTSPLPSASPVNALAPESPASAQAPSPSAAPIDPTAAAAAANIGGEPMPAYNNTGRPLPSSASGSDRPPPTAAMPLEPPPLPQDTRLESALQHEAERSFYDKRRKTYNDTFERAYQGLVPLGPNEVRETMSRYERTQRSAVPPATGQPRGQVRIRTLSLEPGSEPPTINVATGYVTTIAIVDATGEPWPIMDMGIGGNFEVNKTGGVPGEHVVRVMPLTRFGYGNLSVLLQDLATPIIFKLATGGSTVDYRFDARIPRLGPNAKLSLIERRALHAGSAEIMTFLDNAPPPDAKRVRISGADTRTMGWLYNNRMFVRTQLTMLSPSWDASVSSADGTTVYELGEAPVLLMSDQGNIIRARVAQKENE